MKQYAGWVLPAVAALMLGGCVSDQRELTIVEPTYSYLDDPVALDALAAWPMLPVMAEAEAPALVSGDVVADAAKAR